MRVEFGVTRRRREGGEVANGGKTEGTRRKTNREEGWEENKLSRRSPPGLLAPPRAITKSDFFFRHAPSTMTKRRLKLAGGLIFKTQPPRQY